MNIHKRNKRRQAAAQSRAALLRLRDELTDQLRFKELERAFPWLVQLSEQQLLEIARVKRLPADIMNSFPGGFFGGQLTFSMSTPADRLGLIFPVLGAKK